MTDRAPVPLPQKPSLEWLRKQAKRDLERLRERDPDARLADAQFALDGSYGFTSWRALKAHIDSATDRTAGPVARLTIKTDEIYGAAFSPDLTATTFLPSAGEGTSSTLYRHRMTFDSGTSKAVDACVCCAVIRKLSNAWPGAATSGRSCHRRLIGHCAYGVSRLASACAWSKAMGPE